MFRKVLGGSRAAIVVTIAAAAGVAAGAVTPGEATAQGPLQFADLGTCATASGEVVEACRVGYRTLGELSASGDNAVLVPTWYAGDSEGLMRLVTTAEALDTAAHFLIFMDALGNGVSTSPSNSTSQSGAGFPRLTIGDMVDAQHRVVTEHLGLERLHAVVGFSMGAEQAFEWAVGYPDFVDAVVSLHGTPRLAAHDHFVLRSLRWAVVLSHRAGLPIDSVRMPMVDLWHVLRTSPAMENEVPLDSLEAIVASEAMASWTGFDSWDNLLQLEAMLGHDVGARFDGDLDRAAAAVRARLLIVTTPDDQLVTEGPSLAFAEIAGATTFSVPSRCGHFALYCEAEIGERVRAFLAETPRGG
jgi:homoserine O-acetyltransferase